MSVYLEHTELFIPKGKKIELEFNMFQGDYIKKSE